MGTPRSHLKISEKHIVLMRVIAMALITRKAKKRDIRRVTRHQMSKRFTSTRQYRPCLTFVLPG